MNRSSIEWTDHTWNPVTGCKHGCSYCYARRLAEGRLKGRFGYVHGFEPTFHVNRLDEPGQIKKPSKIFVCSMGDLFGEWVPSRWICSVLEVIRANPQHQFQVLTKNPSRIARWFNISENIWLGTSIDGLENSMGRIEIIRKLPQENLKFISFEPILADIANKPEWKIGINSDGIDWVIVGAQTGPNAKEPRLDWIKNMLFDCECAGIPFFMKNNVPWNGPRPQEYPISQNKGIDEI